MLNEKLYYAIKAVFGETPKIVNEGMPATLSDIHPQFTFVPRVTNLGTNNTRGGEQYAVSCPHCHDTRQRLYFNYLWDSTFSIEGCDYHASEYLMHCFNEDCFNKEKNPDNEKHVIQAINALREAMRSPSIVDVSGAEMGESSGSIANQVPYPHGTVELSQAPEYVLDYIYNRGYSTTELDEFKVKYLPYFGKFKQGLLVLPVYQNDEYYFWQGRLVPLDGRPNGPLERDEQGKEYPKYYIPYGAKKSWALGNIDTASMYNTIYVVEGLFDVYAVGRQATCKFGRDLSRAQQNILQTKCRGKKIILVPDMNDPEALPSAEKDMIALQLSGAFSSVELLKLPEGMDPGMIKEKGGNICDYSTSRTISLVDSTESVFGIPECL